MDDYTHNTNMHTNNICKNGTLVDLQLYTIQMNTI